GRVPVIVKASGFKIPAIPVFQGCTCIRAVAAKTCGGTLFEVDGVTPSTDCSPRFTAGDSVCAAAGKPPCSFVHGAGNSASGSIGCAGLEGVDVQWSQDSGGTSGVAGPPMLSLSGHGGPGSASIANSLAVTAFLYPSCTGRDPIFGPDDTFCTDDDNGE